MEKLIEIFLPLLIVSHFIWHFVAMVGVTMGIWHSYSVHTHARWKIGLAGVWLLVSLIIMYHSLMEVI